MWADPNVENSEGFSALSYGPDLAELLVQHGARLERCSKPPLKNIIDTNDPRIVAAFLGLRANCNESPERRETPDPNIERPDVDMNNPSSEWNPLYIAAVLTDRTQATSDRDGRAAIVRLLLDHGGCNPYATLEQDRAVIHEIFRQDRSILEPFLSYPGLDLENRDPKGRTILLAACSRGAPKSRYPGDPWAATTWKYDILREQLVQTLIDRGADVTARDKDGKGVFHCLLHGMNRRPQRQFDNALASVASSYPALLDVRDNKGRTALHYTLGSETTNNRKVKQARILISAGATVLGVDASGSTILHALSKQINHEDVNHDLFQLTVDRGVDINTRNESGHTPLYTFLSHVRVSHLGPILFEPEDGFPYAFKPGLLATLEKNFIANGADVFTKDDQGCGLLHVLAKRKAAFGGLNDLGDLFQYFVDKGLDPWLEDQGHMTPLDVAAVWENEAILEKFRKEKREEREMDMETGTETLDE